MSNEKLPDNTEPLAGGNRREVLKKIGVALAASAAAAASGGAMAQLGQVDRRGGNVIEIPKDVKLVADDARQGWAGAAFIALQGSQVTVAVADATSRDNIARLQKVTGMKGVRARVVNGVINVDFASARRDRCIIRDVTLEGVIKKTL
jgi:hypothetical protein